MATPKPDPEARREAPSVAALGGNSRKFHPKTARSENVMGILFWAIYFRMILTGLVEPTPRTLDMGLGSWTGARDFELRCLTKATPDHTTHPPPAGRSNLARLA